MKLFHLLPLLVLVSCTQPAAIEMPVVEIHGHRGCRGLMPENSIPGFILSAELGAQTLEMDVVLTGDNEVVVSHEPWFNTDICLDSSGNRFSEKTSLLSLSLSDIRKCDCGSLGNPKFPTQQKMAVAKPALWEVFAVTEHMLSIDSLRLNYNIEIKYEENEFFPDRFMLVGRVMEEISKAGVASRTTIQSFDPMILEIVKSVNQDIKLSFLVEDLNSVSETLQKLTFKPYAISPEFNALTAEKVQEMHDLGIVCLPWTVNDPAEMSALINMKVDGIITDYPDRLYTLLHEK
ncbi:MAG: glycerophosphodiester phosphodiesterase [Cryomorphaceae bacterium]|nr:glycerophosphodiester phosphodiesterase [Cryomorphaceae bacterium]